VAGTVRGHRGTLFTEVEPEVSHDPCPSRKRVPIRGCAT
jgi:hypothetical protein